MIFAIIFCHLIGDYVMQSNFIARTKGENWYHLFVHSILYCLPFGLWLGFDSRLILLAVSHFLIDMGKARYKVLNYAKDQIFHYLMAVTLYVVV